MSSAEFSFNFKLSRNSANSAEFSGPQNFLGALVEGKSLLMRPGSQIKRKHCDKL